jgi:hypothetical protein
VGAGGEIVGEMFLWLPFNNAPDCTVNSATRLQEISTFGKSIPNMTKQGFNAANFFVKSAIIVKNTI